MATLLLVIIYIAFVSLGLPDGMPQPVLVGVAGIPLESFQTGDEIGERAHRNYI